MSDDLVRNDEGSRSDADSLSNTQLSTDGGAAGIQSAIDEYKLAIDKLSGTSQGELPTTLLRAFVARDNVAAEIAKDRTAATADSMMLLIDLDQRLKLKSDIAHSFGASTLQGWRETSQAAPTAWWWFLEQRPKTRITWESVLTVVAWVVIAISFSIIFEAVRRFLAGRADLPSAVLQGLIALVSAGVLVRAAKTFVGGNPGDTDHERLQLTRRTRLTLAVSSVAIACIVAWSSPWIARAYNDWGVRLYSAGKLSDAVEKYRRATSLEPSYAVAHYNIGNVYEDIREYDNAMSEYQSAIMADSEFYAAYNNLARLYILHRKDYVGALQLLDRALTLNVDAGPEALPLIRYMMYKNRGWANLELKYYSQAREDLEQSLSLRDDGAEAYCLLAEVLEAQQDNNGAVERWKKCQELGSIQGDEIDPAWLGLAREKLK